MSNLSTIPSFGEILLALLVALLGFAGIALVAFWGFRRKDHSDALSTAKEEGVAEEHERNLDKDLSSLEAKFDKEMGGNGNGMREAVNAIRESVAEMKEVQKDIAKDAGETKVKVAETAVLLGEHIRNHERKIA